MATKSIRLSDGTDTLLPESAQSASGYQKCADGTLIQWGAVSSGAISANGTTSTEVTFGIAFISTPIIMVTVGTSAPRERYATFGNESRTGFKMYFGVQSATGGLGGHWIAIGRWK